MLLSRPTSAGHHIPAIAGIYAARTHPAFTRSRCQGGSLTSAIAIADALDNPLPPLIFDVVSSDRTLTRQARLPR